MQSFLHNFTRKEQNRKNRFYRSI